MTDLFDFVWFCGDRAAERFFFLFTATSCMLVLFSLAILSFPLGKVGAGCCPGHMFEHPRFVSSRAMSLPLGAGGGLRSVIGATPGYLLIVFLCCFLLLHLTKNARFHPCIFFVKQYFTKSNATSKVYV